MARWNPQSEDPVGKNEHVGRRLFNEPLLVGAQNHSHFAGLDLRNFEETRDREFSLDRLGRSGVENVVVRYLRPRADAAGEKFTPPKPINGWAVLRVRQLENPPKGSLGLAVIASPITGIEVNENIYHAHVVLPQSPDHYFMALHLRNLFSTYGEMKSAEPVEQPPHRFLKFAPTWLRRLLLGRDDRERRD
jgi:hypothetical protein